MNALLAAPLHGNRRAPPESPAWIGLNQTFQSITIH